MNGKLAQLMHAKGDAENYEICMSFDTGPGKRAIAEEEETSVQWDALGLT